MDQRLEARFEVAAVARAGEQRAEVEREDLRVLRRSSGTSPLRMRCASPSAIAVLPTPVSPTRIGLFLRRRARMWMVRSSLGVASDQRIQRAGFCALAEVAGEGGERVGGNAGLVRVDATRGHLGFAGSRPAGRRTELRDAVRDVLQHVESRHALRAQQLHGVRVGLLEDRRQQIARFDLVFLRALRVVERVLHHAVEGERLERGRLGVVEILDVFIEEALECEFERREVGAGVPQHLDAARVVREREQQMLDRDVGVVSAHRLAEGRLNGELQLAPDLRQSPIPFPRRSGAGSRAARPSCAPSRPSSPPPRVRRRPRRPSRCGGSRASIRSRRRGSCRTAVRAA